MTNEKTQGRGRPANFPGVETVAFLAHIPVETREMVRQEAEAREVPIAVALNLMIERSFRDAERRRSRSKKASN